MEKITVPVKLESLKTVAEYVLQAAEGAGLDYRASYRLRLAVDEIATNIITHGYRHSQASGTLQMGAEIDEEFLTIYLDDDGTNYDPSQALPPDQILGPPQQRDPGGLGIYLALSGVDEFLYQRCVLGNRSTFRVQRHRPH